MDRRANSTIPPHPLEDWIANYLSYLAVEKRFSRSSLMAHRSLLEQWSVWFRNSLGSTTSWVNLTKSDLIAFLGVRRRAGVSDVKINSDISILQKFYNYVQLEGLTENNPAHNLIQKKNYRGVPQFLSKEEMAVLLNFKVITPVDIRDSALLEILYSTGIRVGELIRIDLNDLNLDERLLLVFGIGRRDRYLPLGRPAVRAVNRWLGVRDDFANNDEKALFVNSSGTRFTGSAINKICRERSKAAKLKANASPRVIRNSCAAHFYENTCNLRAVQELLGHASLRTTEIYAQWDIRYIKEVYQASHPRALSNQTSGMKHKNDPST